MLRIGLRLLALVLVLLVVAVGGLFLVSGERLAKIASDQLTSSLDREVRITEGLRPQLFPSLGVRTGSFQIAGTEGDADLITGDGLSVAVDLLALLSSRVDVKEVTLLSPSLTLVKTAEGNNWSEADAETGGEASGGAGAPDLTLAALSVQDGTVRYRDDVAGLDVLFEDVNVSAALPSRDAPLVVDMSFLARGQSASGTVELASLAGLLAGDMTGLTMALAIGENDISFDGEASSDGVLLGDFGANLPAPDALMAMTGRPPSPLPAEVLPIEVSGALDVSPETISIGGGAYRFGANRFQGPVSIALRDVPFVQAELSGRDLDLSFLAAEEGSATGDAPAAEGKGWSTDPIDASGLSLLDADIRLNANTIDLGTTKMQDLSATVTIERARAVARILEAKAFGGALVGQFVANNRNGLSVAGEMDGKTVAIQALLTDVAGFERMRGAGNTQLSFLGIGQSVDAIMKSLSGNGALDIGQGDITGFDLASLFGGGSTAEAVGDRATTIFESLTASFVIEDGVMRNDDLLISANLFEATGRGDIDLGQQRLDYTLRPEVFENDLTGGLSIPVRLEGPWSDLSIYPDLEAVARERLRLEEEKLKAEAEARLDAERQRLEERANTRIDQEKQNLEEKLGNELRRGLRGLFD